jgi:hypothetical protein
MEYADYRRIANDIQTKIDKDELKPGDRLAFTSDSPGRTACPLVLSTGQ